jgi:Alpha/beta hydrolase domain
MIRKKYKSRDQVKKYYKFSNGAIGRSAFVLAPISFAVLLTACSGGSDTASVAPTQSALLPVQMATPCPITSSSIDSLVTKGTGLAFNGATFGGVGTYSYILAEATGKVSAKDSCASTIVDLKNAGDASGNVTYTFDVIVLMPTDKAKANGSLLYIVNNRTNTSSFEALNDGSSNDLFTSVAPVIPTTATAATTGTGAGSAYLMKQGFTVVFSGWQGDRPQTLNVPSATISTTNKWFAPGMTLPVALNGGAQITGNVQDEFIADSATLTTNLLGTYYKRAPGTAATLTIQKTATSTPITVDSSYWTYTAGNATAEGGNTTASGYGFVTIDRAKVVADSKLAAALDAGADNGSIYQFNYTAIDPKPLGLGFLGVRDLISYFKNGASDAKGNPNPLAGRVKYTLTTGISQSGRYIRDFLWQGFNTDAAGKQVFDGMLPLVGGSRKTYTNYRWAKPGDYSRQHETHYTPGDQFPFAYSTITDPLTGKTDGLQKLCAQNSTCPKVIQYDSPIEFNGARASLTVTDGQGKDIDIPSNVRMFYAAGTSHGPQVLASNAKTLPDYSSDSRTGSGAASSPGALIASTALFRSLLSNLDGWVKGTQEPLASSFPKVSDKTMAVPTSSPSSLGAPDLSGLGLGFNGGYNELSVNDESVIPSIPSNKFYVVHLPTSDAQGNDKGGVLMPDLAVPLTTSKGYNLRKSGFVAGDQNGLSSSQLPFALLTSAKKTSDPRKSVQELYSTKANYKIEWDKAVDALATKKLLLPDDVTEYKNRVQNQIAQPTFTLP